MGCLPAFGADPLGTLLAGWREFGDVVRFRGPVPRADLFLVVHPEHLDEVLSVRHLEYPHTASFDARFGASGGHGIVTAEGEKWAAERAEIEPLLAPGRVSEVVPSVASAAAAALRDVLPDDGAESALDLQDVMRHASLQMLGPVLFGPGWGEHRAPLTHGVETFIQHVSQKLSSPVNVPERVPTARNRRFRSARARYDASVAAIVDGWRRTDAAAGDVLGGLIAAADRLGHAHGSGWVRDQVTNHFAAGHSTVQATLSWACHLLGRYPEVQDRLRDEARSVLVSEVPTREELGGLELTRMALFEAMRLYPPLSLQPRSPVSDDVLGGYRIPKGAPLFISSYLTHRHSDFWDEPETFRPERFADGAASGMAPGSYWPFSHGPRRCVGEHLAMVEMSAVLGLLLRQHRIVLDPRLPVRPQLGIALEPAGGVPARLVPA